MTNPLSPATHAVIDAYTDAPVSGRIALAAALRAAADQLYDSASQDYLWKLANELENIND